MSLRSNDGMMEISRNRALMREKKSEQAIKNNKFDRIDGMGSLFLDRNCESQTIYLHNKWFVFRIECVSAF